MSKKFDWTEERLQYLIEHFPNECGADIADVIGCSATTVCVKARSLGLKKSPDFHTWDYMGRYVKHGVIVREKYSSFASRGLASQSSGAD